MHQQPVIGVDLGVTAPSELAVAVGSTVEATRRAASTPAGLTLALARMAQGRPVAVVVESTAMAWFVAAVAATRSGITHTLYRVSGAKAAALRAFYRAHTKTDRNGRPGPGPHAGVDDTLRVFTLPAPGELALRRLVMLRHKLGTEATRLANRTRSTLHWAAPGLVRAAGGTMSEGLLSVLGRWPDLTRLATARVASIASVGDWHPERAAAVRAAAAEAVAFYDGFVDFAALALELQVTLAQRTALRAQLACLDKRIKALHAARHPDDLLLSIPGIGPVVAAVVRAVLGDLARFANLASLRAYTGLVPRECSSGEARRRGRISKAGPAVLRWALYLAADSARQWDPALAALYHRLMVERGRTHSQALCAVASHLVGRIWAVTRAGRAYQWRDLEGNPVSRDQARALAVSLRVDPDTRIRLRAQHERGPDASRARQPKAPQDNTQPSADNLIEAALELARTT
jgi:transposase